MSTDIAPTTPQAVAADFETKAQRAVKFANSFLIESDDDYQLAAEELRSIKERAKAVEAERTKITVPMNTALQAVNDMFRAPKSLFDSVEGIFKAKMLAWQSKQAAFAEAARKEAERQAEARRREIEHDAEMARGRAEEEARRLRELGNAEAAAAVEAKGEEAVAALQLEAETTVAQPLAVAAPRATGISTAKSNEVTVVNKYEFAKFCVDAWERDPGMLDYLNIDGVKLRAAGRTHGTALNWPGLAVGGKSTIRVR